MPLVNDPSSVTDTPSKEQTKVIPSSGEQMTEARTAVVAEKQAAARAELGIQSTVDEEGNREVTRVQPAKASKAAVSPKKAKTTPNVRAKAAKATTRVKVARAKVAKAKGK